MSNYPKHVWDQLKNTTVNEFIRALERDGFIRDQHTGDGGTWTHEETKRSVTLHIHPRKTWGPKFLKGLLDNAGWDESRLRELKLIK